ncbi:MAG: FAD-dependent monooxygenase [Burkholderiales bacterium]
MSTTAAMAATGPLQLAVIGAGPVGLCLALMAARRLPQAQITVYDAQADDAAVACDARTLALSLGTVQTLERLGVWRDIAPRSAAIEAVHVSQQQPALLELLRPGGQGVAREPAVWIRARELGVGQLGAVVAYGALTQPLRQAWRQLCETEPQRLAARFGVPVTALRPVAGGTEVDAGVVERVDLAVVAEGGVFADQARKAVHRDYHQTAWVGRLRIEGGEAGVAFERFTPNGPAALLPLPLPFPHQPNEPAEIHEAALVWCVASDDDPVRELNDAQRLTLLGTLFPAEVGRLVGLSPLKAFPLGLNAERSLVQGRTVRIGNAAQTLHPVAGQGLNLGLRDVHALVQRLAREPDVDRALRQVEWQRAPDRWAMIAATDFLARSFTWQLPGLSTVRGAGLAAVQRLPWVKRQLAQRMMFGTR